MRRSTILAVALAAILATPLAAQARHHHRHHHISHYSGDPRPSAWCGWGLKHFLGLTGTYLNRAASWAGIGHPTQPKPGAIVVYPHHVGQIVKVVDSTHAIVHSFNDGHRERTRERSIAGAIAFREL